MDQTWAVEEELGKAAVELGPRTVPRSGISDGNATEILVPGADVLAAGASYPPITVTLNVAANAINQFNVATVSGGGCPAVDIRSSIGSNT